MPRIAFNITLDTPDGLIAQLCDSACLRGKEANEVYHSLDAVRVWRDRFERLYGNLINCVHHSNPDDPPDMTFIFRDKTIAVEHTRLQPSHYGWMDALHHKECPGQCIVVPSVAFQPQSRDDLLSAMSFGNGGWLDYYPEMKKWVSLCVSIIRKKIEHSPEGLLVIQDTSLIFETDLRPIAEAIHALLTAQHGLIRNWTILFHSRHTPKKFISYLIAEKEGLQFRANGNNELTRVS